MKSLVRSCVSALAVSLATAAAAGPSPQYVIISFDGAKDNALWERSLKLADETGARFTYFLSCVYFIPTEAKAGYQAPGKRAGRSNVGFGDTAADVQARLGHVWAAYQSGHDIASHACGHFDGKDWSQADWTAEFNTFGKVMAKAWTASGGNAPAGWDDFVRHGFKGFRVPYLSTSAGLAPALAEAGFAYDASGVSRGPQAPLRRAALTEFALPMIPEGPKGRRIIAMDYNLFVRHSGGFERASQAEEFAERTYQAFKGAFEAELGGARTPLQIGFHFQPMNGGAYWTALERFAREVCVRPDVACVSYADWLRANPPRPVDTAAAGG
ncbi:polysaccharide deacetylase [Mesorhizobium sp. J428]|uniref:polysaccharide deacetylase n=1 Tax=Mesorhizobium sp. J428 TaxID=2898440 RepID=UPI002151A60B|nr:polysaccharide deacetylase [Mesorhizobium sp. J428]MCR5858671.1 polysaccharide deacetylase [Mesorhizobium sp. J428]